MLQPLGGPEGAVAQLAVVGGGDAQQARHEVHEESAAGELRGEGGGGQAGQAVHCDHEDGVGSVLGRPLALAEPPGPGQRPHVAQQHLPARGGGGGEGAAVWTRTGVKGVDLVARQTAVCFVGSWVVDMASCWRGDLPTSQVWRQGASCAPHWKGSYLLPCSRPWASLEGFGRVRFVLIEVGAEVNTSV